jgi:predicted lipoprotein with Yx(FWY)xxD motif
MYQLSANAIFFAAVTGFTHYTFKQTYMRGAAAAATAAAGPPPPYSANTKSN